MKTLAERGSEYLRKYRAKIRRIKPGVFRMPSASSVVKDYDVRVGERTWCDCFQFVELHKLACKHTFAGEKIEEELASGEPVVISREALERLVRQANGEEE